MFRLGPKLFILQAQKLLLASCLLGIALKMYLEARAPSRVLRVHKRDCYGIYMFIHTYIIYIHMYIDEGNLVFRSAYLNDQEIFNR